ncbi:MAG: hypothetical protein J3K34DRAFT_459145 [Monoraphidium minutum]|nr:MAG: hypothetical protein J3K34DRAFT_459145 [Monoraphidium minutum]
MSKVTHSRQITARRHIGAETGAMADKAPFAGLPEGGLAAILAHLPDRADLRALRLTCRALRGAGAGAARTVRVSLFQEGSSCSDRGAAVEGMAAAMARFPNATTLEFVQPQRARSAWIIQAASLQLMQHLHACAAPPTLAHWRSATPLWPRITRVVGCPSMCVKSLVALCPGIASLHVACADAMSLLPDAVRPLSALSGLMDLVFAAPLAEHCWQYVPGKLHCTDATWHALGALTRLRHLSVDCRWSDTHAHRAPPALTALTVLRAPLSTSMCQGLAAATGLRHLAFMSDGTHWPGPRSMPQLHGMVSHMCIANPNIRGSQLYMGHLFSPGAPAEALTYLMLPGVEADQPLIESLAEGCPNLRMLALLSIQAGEGCWAAFPHLTQLLCGFSPDFSCDLNSLAPSMQRLDLRAGPDGVPRYLSSRDVVIPELGLLDALSTFIRRGEGMRFLEEHAASAKFGLLQLHAPLTFNSDGDDAHDLWRLFRSCGPMPWLRRLSIKCDHAHVEGPASRDDPFNVAFCALAIWRAQFRSACPKDKHTQSSRSLCSAGPCLALPAAPEGASSAELLAARGVAHDAIQSAINRCPELLGSATAGRVEPIMQLLAAEGFKEPRQIDLLLLKCPQARSYARAAPSAAPRLPPAAPLALPTYCRAKAEASLEFLSEALGLDPRQRAEVVRRFPQVLGYGAKSWLQPQLAFLRSLGVGEAELPALVMARPQVLGSNILLVTKWLTRFVRLPRTKVGAVLDCYPFDYSPAFCHGLRKYVAAQTQAAAAAAAAAAEGGEGGGAPPPEGGAGEIDIRGSSKSGGGGGEGGGGTEGGGAPEGGEGGTPPAAE